MLPRRQATKAAIAARPKIRVTTKGSVMSWPQLRDANIQAAAIAATAPANSHCGPDSVRWSRESGLTSWVQAMVILRESRGAPSFSPLIVLVFVYVSNVIIQI